MYYLKKLLIVKNLNSACLLSSFFLFFMLSNVHLYNFFIIYSIFFFIYTNHDFLSIDENNLSASFVIYLA